MYTSTAKEKPLEIIKSATGEELNVRHLIRYLEEKYTTLYLKKPSRLYGRGFRVRIFC